MATYRITEKIERSYLVEGEEAALTFRIIDEEKAIEKGLLEERDGKTFVRQFAALMYFVRLAEEDSEVTVARVMNPERV
jgi:hypothetical protein